MKKSILTKSLFLVPAIALVGVLSGTAEKKEAPAPRITSEIKTNVKSTMTPEEKRHVSVAGARVLKHVHQARKAIANEDAKSAQSHVDKGLLLVDIIERVRPSYEVAAKVTAGDLVYEDTEEVKASLIPIYEELDNVTVIYPVVKASEDAADEKAAAEEDEKASSDKKDDAAEESADSEAPALVADADLDYTSVKMDIVRAKAGLNVAKKLLAAEKDVKFNIADTALAAAQSSVIFEYVEVDQPLQEARTNLGLAKTLFEAGNKKGAKVALKIASDSLQAYADGTGEHRTKDVEALKKEIDELIGKLDSSSSEDAAAQTAGWWEKVRGWFK